MRIIGACDVTRASSRIARRRILRFAELVVSWGGPRRIHVDALVDALHDAAVGAVERLVSPLALLLRRIDRVAEDPLARCAGDRDDVPTVRRRSDRAVIDVPVAADRGAAVWMRAVDLLCVRHTAGTLRIGARSRGRREEENESATAALRRPSLANRLRPMSLLDQVRRARTTGHPDLPELWPRRVEGGLWAARQSPGHPPGSNSARRGAGHPESNRRFARVPAYLLPLWIHSIARA